MTELEIALEELLNALKRHLTNPPGTRWTEGSSIHDIEYYWERYNKEKIIVELKESQKND